MVGPKTMRQERRGTVTAMATATDDAEEAGTIDLQGTEGKWQREYPGKDSHTGKEPKPVKKRGSGDDVLPDYPTEALKARPP